MSCPSSRVTSALMVIVSLMATTHATGGPAENRPRPDGKSEVWIRGLPTEALRAEAEREFGLLMGEDASAAASAVGFFSERKARPVLAEAVREATLKGTRRASAERLLEFSDRGDVEAVEALRDAFHFFHYPPTWGGLDQREWTAETQSVLAAGLARLTGISFEDVELQTEVGQREVLNRVDKWLNSTRTVK